MGHLKTAAHTGAERIRVAITYRVCQHWRAPMFARLAADPRFEVLVLHGEDVPGTKLINTQDFTGIPHRQLRTHSLPVRTSGRSTPVCLYPSVIGELDRFRPDVVLCEGGSNIANNLLIYSWAAARGAATIWWSLGELPGRRFSGLGRAYKGIVNTLMRRSTALLGYSSQARLHFESVGCTQPTFVAVNCVDTELTFNRISIALASPRAIRQELNCEGKIVLLYVGALTAPKRVDDLLVAFGMVRATRNDVALLIVGDGPVRAPLERQAAELGLADVHFTGAIHEGLSHYFLAADLFVLPGLGGLAVSEAMCHSLPVLCTVADGCERDLVADGTNGYIVADGAPGTLAQVISELASHPQRLKQMGAASLDLIKSKYNVESYMKNVASAIICANALRVRRRSHSQVEV